MDLKDIKNKDVALEKINLLVEQYKEWLLAMANGEYHDYKKSVQIYYWLRDFKNYIRNEKNFSPRYLPEYKRGNIIKLDFGFNIGDEFGGLHYAVVLKDSNAFNKVVLVAPMKSLSVDVTKLHANALYLGKELYDRMYGKCSALKINIKSEIDRLNKRTQEINAQALLINQAMKESGENAALRKLLDELSNESAAILEMIKQQNEQYKIIAQMQKDLNKLKTGTVVSIDQIRTISKQRISNPVSKTDTLYQISLSAASMEQIDAKIRQIYTGKS